VRFTGSSRFRWNPRFRLEAAGRSLLELDASSAALKALAGWEAAGMKWP